MSSTSPPPGSSSPEAPWRIRAPHATEWTAYYRLRWAVLRAPWGQPPGSERDELEASAWHRLAALADGSVIACGRLHRDPAAPDSGVLRYMAVDPAWRGRGVGSALLASLEAAARQAGLSRLRLAAREAAVPFYRRHGYRPLGPGHTLFGEVRHVRMQKSLTGGPEIDPDQTVV